MLTRQLADLIQRASLPIRQSLRRQVMAIIIAAIVISSGLMLMLTWAATETAADSFIERQLQMMLTQLQAKNQQGDGLQLLNDGPWQSWAADDPELPRYLVRFREPGIYELGHPKVHVAVAAMPPSDTLALLQYEPDRDPWQPAYANDARQILFALILILLVVGLLLAKPLAGWIVTPVLALKRQVDTASPDLPPQPLDRPDEIGQLSASFHQAFTRTAQFIEREQQFTRYASHELRTPVTVIQGALELLQLQPLTTAQRRPLARVEEANRDMSSLITTFLELGREQGSPPSANQVDLTSCLEAALSNLLVPPTLQIDWRARGAPRTVPEQEAWIVCHNLLRNALAYADCKVTIRIRGSLLWVSNDIPASTPDSGYGFGQEIVQRLCHRYGWPFRGRLSGKRYQTLVVFNACDPDVT